ncbi:DUF2975 domain-containing protein [Arthrobacter sp.]|uniref:DUF2975 domain-containing protein n=1 Tax=Arthrobacter sp. TaxID=1667 RepID=UPI0028974F3F|nr:DUF2975 domain-containing protein [Arthrobacter sp.]
MTRQETLPLRCVLAALALAALLAQLVLVPGAAAGFAADYPEVAYLAAPYVTVIVVAIGGFEVALFAAWQLLSAAERGGASDGWPPRWANLMAASLGFMAVLFAGVFAHTGFAGVGSPPMLFGLLASLALVPGAVVLRHKARGFPMRA